MRGKYGFVKLITQTAEQYLDPNSEGLETPDEPLVSNSKRGEKKNNNNPLFDDDVPGVTFLKQPSDARFAVTVAEFGLDAEADDA
jgi:hypothetical protein